jgi:hypothetical protein
MNAATAALEEYANPHNWIRTEEGWVYSGWIFIDEEPWARAADALAKGEDDE